MSSSETYWEERGRVGALTYLAKHHHHPKVRSAAREVLRHVRESEQYRAAHEALNSLLGPDGDGPDDGLAWKASP